MFHMSVFNFQNWQEQKETISEPVGDYFEIPYLDVIKTPSQFQPCAVKQVHHGAEPTDLFWDDQAPFKPHPQKWIKLVFPRL